MVANKWDYSHQNEKTVNHPRVCQILADLTLPFAKDNLTRGYDRRQRALAYVEYHISGTTVSNILEVHCIEPAPTDTENT